MTDMKDRIKQVMEAQHMTQQTFANFIGINAASLSSIFNNRTRPTLNTVEAIKSKIPNLNTDWLMFGHGTMFDEGKNADNGHVGDDEGKNVSHPVSAEGLVPDLFAGSDDVSVQQPQVRQNDAKVRTEIKYVDRPRRQITEIKVYFDDLTYETFVPKKWRLRPYPAVLSKSADINVCVDMVVSCCLTYI